MSSSQCPDTQSLSSFLHGELSTAEWDSIEAHVAGCEACHARLESLETHDDELLSELRTIGAVKVRHSMPAEITENALSVLHEGSGVSRSLTLDSGKHYARLLKEGSCRLGRFELLEELGIGSFGYVFKARDVELDRVVAIKVQRAGAFASDEEVARFLREARSTAALTHPAIVALFDTGRSEDGVCFLVTEFVEGETLEACLRRRRLTLNEATAIATELADAVQHAHEHGIVHRDLKPSNVILDKSGKPHITDFGLAKRSAVSDPSMTSEGRVMGTPAYMSPEQAAGEESVDARTDVYSLGVILYEMLTGERPFHGSNRLLLLQVLEDEPRRPRQLERAIPKDLETICLKAMAKSPGRRYKSARQLAEDLLRFSRGDAIEARPCGLLERGWRWCRRNRVAAVLFLSITLGLAVGFAYLTSLSSYFVRETALDSARMEADMLERVNEYYSEILSRIETNAVAITHEYAMRKNALPLPFTFTIDAGQRISETESGLQIRLYGRYPWRSNGGPKDAFQREALNVLDAVAPEDRVHEAKREFHEFTEIGGRQFLNYARGQVMKETCVRCHNAHPQSPKKDWKVNDLAGVLLVSRPLDRDIERTHSGLRSATVLMGATVIGLVASAVLLAFRGGK